MCVDNSLLISFPFHSFPFLGRFENADAVFTLSFSIILLNTDLHNPNIPSEKKMNKQGFVRNNQGINGGGDFDIKFQHDIFDRINENQISLREDEKAREKLFHKTSSLSSGGFFGRSVKEVSEEAYFREREGLLCYKRYGFFYFLL